MTTTPPTRMAAGVVAPSRNLGTRAAAGGSGYRSETRLRQVAACATVTVHRGRRDAVGGRRSDDPCRRAYAGDRLRCPLTVRAERCALRRCGALEPSLRTRLRSTPAGWPRRSARSAPRGYLWAAARRFRASRGARGRRSPHRLRRSCRVCPSCLQSPRRPASRSRRCRYCGLRRRHPPRALPGPPASAPVPTAEATRRQEPRPRPGRPRKRPAPRAGRAPGRAPSATGGRARSRPQRSTAGRRRPQCGQSLRSFWTSCSREQPHRRRFSTL